MKTTPSKSEFGRVAGYQDVTKNKCTVKYQTQILENQKQNLLSEIKDG